MTLFLNKEKCVFDKWKIYEPNKKSQIAAQCSAPLLPKEGSFQRS